MPKKTPLLGLSRPPERMDAELKAKWLERLRDPDTQQTCATLRRRVTVTHHETQEEVTYHKYCCLGVFCELHPNIELKEFEGDATSYARYRGGTVEHPMGGMGMTLYTVKDGEAGEVVGFPFNDGGETGDSEYVWSSQSFIPLPAARDAGLTEHVQRRLSEMNDGGCSFTEIADWIEEFL